MMLHTMLFLKKVLYPLNNPPLQQYPAVMAGYCLVLNFKARN